MNRWNNMVHLRADSGCGINLQNRGQSTINNNTYRLHYFINYLMDTKTAQDTCRLRYL